MPKPIDLLTLRNVVGFGDGQKLKGDEVTSRHCLTVFVKSKVAKKQLSESEMVPSKVDGVPTDVVETGDLKPLSAPLMGGDAVGAYPSGTWGTLGGVFRVNGQDLGLTNYHVVTNLSDTRRDNRGDFVGTINPNTGERLNPLGQVLTHSSFLPVDVGAGQSGCLSDAAFFTLTNSGGDPLVGELGYSIPGSKMDRWHDQLIGLPGKPLAGWPHYHRNYCGMYRSLGSPQDFTPAGLGIAQKPSALLDTAIPLQKFGARTGYTRTDMTWWNTTFSLDYGGTVGVVNFFKQGFTRRGPNQSRVICAPGDSGSACFDMQGYLVGLLFAGSEIGYIYTPIWLVFKQLFAAELVSKLCLDTETWRRVHGP